MNGFIELTKFEGGKFGEDFSIRAENIAQITPSGRGGTSYVTTAAGETVSVSNSPDEITRKIREADAETESVERFKTAKREVKEWFDFRIEHLKKRVDESEPGAYVRLTEVEAMRDVIGKQLEINF